MKWIYSLISLGCLFLLTVTPSGAKASQTPLEIKPFVSEISAHRDTGVPYINIVQPDPIPCPRPMPKPEEKPKPEPL